MTSATDPDPVAGPLCLLGDVPPGEAIGVDAMLHGVDGTPAPENLVVLRDGDAVHAYLNICPHAGRQLDFAPGKFLLTQGTLICAAHGASFQSRTGLCIGGPCQGQSLRRVPVHVTDGQVWLADAGRP